MAVRAHNLALALAVEFAAIHGTERSTFRHESTMEQWFTKSQFESYRHLGDHETSGLIARMTDPARSLKTLFGTAVATNQKDPGGHHGIRRTAALEDVAG